MTKAVRINHQFVRTKVRKAKERASPPHPARDTTKGISLPIKGRARLSTFRRMGMV